MSHFMKVMHFPCFHAYLTSSVYMAKSNIYALVTKFMIKLISHIERLVIHYPPEYYRSNH